MKRRPTNKTAPWWILFIAATGTVALLSPYLFLFILSMCRHLTVDHLITLLFLWQAQTGAALAIVAAIIGGSFIVYQTTETQRLDQAQRIRKIYALRALLTHDLAELTNYCERSAELFVSLFVVDPAHLEGKPYIRVVEMDIPLPPPGVVERVAALIENYESEEVRPFVLLLERIQVQKSRAAKLKFRAALYSGVARTDVIFCLVDIAEIYARCSKLFIYARAKKPSSVEITTADDIKQAVVPMLFGTDLSIVSEIRDAVDRYAGI